MHTVFVFLGGLIVGFVCLFTIMGKINKREELERKGQEEIDTIKRSEKLRKRRNQPFDRASETLKKFKLESAGNPYNAYFDNDEVFVAYSIKFFDQLLPVSEKEMFRLSEIDLYGDQGQFFTEALERGDVIMFSKSEGRLVYEIVREERGSYLPWKPETCQFNDYYLPDGTLFLTRTNFMTN